MALIPLVVMIGVVGSFVLTAGVRAFALKHSILDIPSHRSSHTTPTPRGGGLAIAIVSLGGIALAEWLHVIPNRLAFALVGGGSVVAGVGWLDDRRGVPAAVRALVHVAAAIWAMYWLGGLSAVDLGAFEVQLGGAGMVLGTLGVVWGINLYNFMDGIDGIAAGEAVCVGAVGGLLLLLAGSPGLACIALLIAAASAGFLLWNWAPAKIFMGDVGSGLLGFLFTVLAVASESMAAVPLPIWMLLAGVFVFDTTVTLLRRVLRGERWYAAHRSHAYQRAVQIAGSHEAVTRAVLGINIVLAVLAGLAWTWTEIIPTALLVAGGFLGWIHLKVEKLRPMSWTQ